jgi:excisionase family DNA binding protein
MQAHHIHKRTMSLDINDIHLAEASNQQLSDYMRTTKKPMIHLVKKGKGEEAILMPPVALKLLMDILSEMAQGNAVRVLPVETELTTQEAAELLNVSRPFLVDLLEQGKIPFRWVGSKRRVLAKDVLSYKEAIDQKRLNVLATLAKEAQEHNMGY